MLKLAVSINKSFVTPAAVKILPNSIIDLTVACKRNSSECNDSGDTVGKPTKLPNADPKFGELNISNG